MIVYYLFFILLLGSSYIYIITKNNKINLYLVSFVLFVAVYLASLRDLDLPNVDFTIYKLHYYGLVDNTMDIGYVFLEDIFKWIGANFHIFLFFIIFLSLIIKIYVLKKISYFWPLLFYLYLLGLFLSKEMATLRMGIAFGFVIWSAYYVIKKDFAKYFFLLLIASLFHKSAILLLPMFFLGRYEFLNNHFIISILLILSLLIGKSGIVASIVEKIMNLDFLSSFYLIIKLKTFSNYDDGTIKGLLLPVILKKIILIGIGMYVLQRYKTTLEYFKIKIFFNYMIVGILLLFLFGDSILWAAGQRFAAYFSVFELFILGYFLMSFNKRLNKLLAFLFILILIGSKFVFQIIKYENVYIPYYTIFERCL